MSAFSGGTTGGLGTNSSSAAATSAGTLAATGSFDLGLAQIGTKTSWTPVKNLTLSAEFIYSHLDQNLTGTYTGTASGLPKQTYTLKDQNAYNGALQILRSF
jgi:hypothetical protein